MTARTATLHVYHHRGGRCQMATIAERGPVRCGDCGRPMTRKPGSAFRAAIQEGGADSA